MPRIALIIVTWNSMKFLPELLLSLKKMRKTDTDTRFIFVDNASNDGSTRYVQEYFPDAVIIQNERNLGFTGGNNVGLRHPVALASDYIALLNPDTVVTEDWLVELIKALIKRPDAAAAQSLLLYDQDRDKVNSAGNEIHFLGFGFSRDNGKRIQDTGYRIQEIAYASGAAVLYRRKALEEIGLFDEDLFMYHDDLDVGWKFLLMGYRNIIVPSSIVYHHYEFSRSIKKYYWMERNRLFLLLTHYKYKTVLLILPALIILEIGLTFFSLIRGFFISRVRAYGWLIAHIPVIIRKHRAVQQIRTQPDTAILPYFVGIITDQEISNPMVKYIMNPCMSVYLLLLKIVVRW